MVNQEGKDEIIRFVLESSAEENEKLALFMAGIQTQNPSFEQNRPAKEKAKDARNLRHVLNRAGVAGEYKFQDSYSKPEKP